MSKIFSPDPIFIQNLEELKKIENEYVNKQYLKIICTKCKKEYVRKIYRMKVNNYSFLCTTCLFCEKANNRTFEQKELLKNKRKQTCLERYGVENFNNIKKAKQTCLERYGVNSFSKTKEYHVRMKQTALEKYGVENISQSQIFKDKMKQNWKNKSEEEKQNIVKKSKQTCLERYGVEHPFQLKEFQDKYKQTCLKKYGVENPFQSKEIQDRYKQTCFEKYGVESASQTQRVKDKLKQIWEDRSSELKKEIQEKSKQTCLERYGVENAMQLESVKEKYKQTCLKKYGVENPTYLPNHKERTKRTCLKKYGVESTNQLQSIKDKARQTCLKKYGVQYPSQNQSIKEKSKQTWAQKTPEELKLIRSKASKKYAYVGQSFDSSWELAVWIWALENGKNIKREPKSFEYAIENEIHTYHPDFEIDGQLIEIKGDQFFKENGAMCNPFDPSKDILFESKHQCGLANGVEFWSKKEMKPILEYVKNRYGKNYLKKFKEV